MEKLQNPQAIEQESFRMIAEELGPHCFSELEFPIVQRVIHASADFDFAKNIVFHPKAIEGGLEAIRRGEGIIVDVEMIRAGINKKGLTQFGKGEVHSFIADSDVVEEAKKLGLTRAIMSMRKAVRTVEGGIYAIGNAPTALFELIRLIRSGQAKPSLVIGVPVGFVSAAESKEELLTCHSIPHIVCRGRKGGSPIAVAIVNALVKLAG